MKMIGCLLANRRTISSSIARHKRARAARVATERLSSSAWKHLRYPALVFLRWRERRALFSLIRLAPANADDAREKLVYLMATMTIDPATPDALCIEIAIKTLKPFERTLAHCLSKRRVPFQ